MAAAVSGQTGGAAVGVVSDGGGAGAPSDKMGGLAEAQAAADAAVRAWVDEHREAIESALDRVIDKASAKGPDTLSELAATGRGGGCIAAVADAHIAGAHELSASGAACVGGSGCGGDDGDVTQGGDHTSHVQRGGRRCWVQALANPAISSFGLGAAALFDRGAIITIDYGADMYTLLNASPAGPGLESRRAAAQLRVRSRLPPPPSAAGRGAAAMMFARPGWCDLTADVDFSQLAGACEAAGLRTLYFGPQAGLETALRLPGRHGSRTAYESDELSRGVCDAFYSLGTFAMLVQACEQLTPGWAPPAPPLPLFARGSPSLLAFSLLCTLRWLGRLLVEHALSCCAQLSPPAVPSERELVAAVADARLPTVSCFRPHWRALFRAVRELLSTGELHVQSYSPLYRPALAYIRADFMVLRSYVERDELLIPRPTTP